MTVAKNQHIDLVFLRQESELNGVLSIFFERPQNFVFEAGDWIDISFSGRELKGGVTYSISSSPTEAELRITFREGVSEVKRALQSLTSEEPLFISQFGNDYGFSLNKHRSTVLIAGGIGIAPFRSMIKEMADTGADSQVTLLYLNQSNTFLFQDELALWQKALSNLSITYISTKDINRKKREAAMRSLIRDTTQRFYISGPPSMVENTEHFLIDLGVSPKNIRIDSFGGY